MGGGHAGIVNAVKKSKMRKLGGGGGGACVLACWSRAFARATTPKATDRQSARVASVHCALHHESILPEPANLVRYQVSGFGEML